MGVNYVLIISILFCLFVTTIALQCWQCGQYNDGVGSITPCINYTHMVLKECPSREHTFCIKYLSEGSVVRDCVPKCTERETWSAKTYCCNEDGCNSSPPTTTTITKGHIFILPICVMVLSYIIYH